MRYECILRYGINSGHEYRFATVRRENGAVKECERMLATTTENMAEHCRDGRVVTGAHPTDPNAVVVAALHAGGRTVYKVVTYRPIIVHPTDDNELEDALLASLYALA